MGSDEENQLCRKQPKRSGERREKVAKDPKLAMHRPKWTLIASAIAPAAVKL